MLGSMSADAAVAKSAKFAARKHVKVEAPVHPALAKSVATPKAKKSAKEKAAAFKGSRRVLSLAENSVWRPETQVVSAWDYDTETWVEAEELTSTWDAQGNPLTVVSKSLLEEGDYAKTTYTYDEYGFVTEEVTYVGTSLEDLAPSSRKVHAYDSQIHNLIVENSEEMWDEASSAWVAVGNVYRRIVTRDDAGNVTSVQVESLYQGAYDPLEKYEFTYGDDGKPVKLVYWVMAFDYTTNEPTGWVEDIIYEQAGWYSFDGQIYDLDCIFEGNNKIKTFTQVYEGEPIGVTNVTYVGDTDDFTAVGDFGYATTVQTWLNYENGGALNHTLYTEDLGDDMVYTEDFVECATFDELGYDLLNFSYLVSEDMLQFGGYLNGEQTLDPDKGYPVDYVLREFYPLEEDWGDEDWGDEDWSVYASRSAVPSEYTAPLDVLDGDWENFIAIKFSGYNDVASSAIDRVAAETAEGKAEYFTIDGRRVNGAPAAGLYIRRTANGSSKVLVK